MDEFIESGEWQEILLNTREQCQILEQIVKEQIKVKDGLIDRLHRELEVYKQDASDKFVDQLMKAVIKVRKDMQRELFSDRWEDLSREELREQYRYIFEDLTDLLEQQNIDSYQTQPGSTFDPAIHQAKLELTQDPTLDKTVKCSLTEGYKKKDKILQPERVVVLQYNKKND